MTDIQVETPPATRVDVEAVGLSTATVDTSSTSRVAVELVGPSVIHVIEQIFDGGIDGGFASSNFGSTEDIDGGFADSTYDPDDNIDGGNA